MAMQKQINPQNIIPIDALTEKYLLKGFNENTINYQSGYIDEGSFG